MATPTLVYCGGGNRRFAELAVAAGYRFGARLPDTCYLPPWFADQDYRRPNRGAYMAALERWRPNLASVVDWERPEQLPEVLDWAEEASEYVERVLIVPKVIGGLPRLPRRVNSRDVVLGYSVPTRYGGTSLPTWEWAGWPVHLLGGSPQAQMHVWRHLAGICEVVSIDGNMANKLATAHCQFWVPGSARGASNRWWPTLIEADGQRWPKDAPYEAFRRSCLNIRAAWEALCGE